MELLWLFLEGMIVNNDPLNIAEAICAIMKDVQFSAFEIELQQSDLLIEIISEPAAGNIHRLKRQGVGHDMARIRAFTVEPHDVFPRPERFLDQFDVLEAK